MEVGTFGVRVALPVVLKTAADWQLFDLTGHSVSKIVVLTGALLLPLFTYKLTRQYRGHFREC